MSESPEDDQHSIGDSLNEFSIAFRKARAGLWKGYTAIKRRIQQLPFGVYILLWIVWTTMGEALSNSLLNRIPVLASYVEAAVQFTGTLHMSNVQLLILLFGVLMFQTDLQRRRFKKLAQELVHMEDSLQTDGGKQVRARNEKGQFKSSGDDDDNLAVLGGALAGGAAGSVLGPGGAVAGALLGAVFGDAQSDEDE